MNSGYKVGDTYRIITLSCFLHINNGGDIDDIPEEEQYLEGVIKYITPEGGLVIEMEQSVLSSDLDGTLDTTLFSGKDIKEVYPDFDGEDNRKYCVPFYDGYPFF